ncbi:MAG: gliding motility-associated C-terminal domain-containing protein [Bacteroidales bacterium]|nr:gliding motility-associated C-terminal domain-containing protein [Bacteroidales bacterium]MBN2755812.1 gliding motility-associated C-terminal domain-containing protein [Bacteroidales bacterium]
MNIRKLFFVTLLFFSYNAHSQLQVTLNSNKINVCNNETVNFTAAATSDGVTPVTDVSFIWNFGDGSQEETGLDIINRTHEFNDGGGYFVRVKVSKGADYDYATIKIQSSLTPNFNGTFADKTEPICPGEQINLIGKVSPVTWKYELTETNIENTPQEVSDTKTYISQFDFKEFDKADVITDAADISSIGINIEHSNLSNIKIELTCPHDLHTIILKNFGGEDKYLGEPIDNESSTEYGVGYDYSWTNSAVGTINSATTIGTTLTSGEYEPDEDFSGLIGCSLNGIWTLNITDNQANDNGYIFSTDLKFNSALNPPIWEFTNTYNTGQWDGSDISGTLNGAASAKPFPEGNNEYIFEVQDNFSCKQDTSLLVNVEKASFTADTIEGDFPLLVNFNNTTSWATTFSWDFDYDSNTSDLENPSFTYETDTIYDVILVAGNDFGCTDTFTTKITVTIPASNFINPPNVFTPNNDGNNDIFFVNTDAIEKLEGWIYTRWGAKVCEWLSVEDAIKGWDGTLNNNGGREASPGVYIYYIKAVGFDKRDYEIKGAFHLFR